jgi:AcrR family transcriptional regulator
MEILRDEGYAAVSSRRIAEKAGLKSKLVHYYFKTMDELYLAVFRQAEQRYFDYQAAALTSDNPMRKLWEMSADASNTKVTGELVALANHRKALQRELAYSSERSRRLQAAIIDKAFRAANLDTGGIPPMLVSLFLTAVSRLLAMDKALGVTAGHAEAAAFVEALLQRIEAGEPPFAGQPAPGSTA